MTRRPPGDAVKKPDQLDVQPPAACVPALQLGGGLACRARESHARTKAAARASRLDRRSSRLKRGCQSNAPSLGPSGAMRLPRAASAWRGASSRGHQQVRTHHASRGSRFHDTLPASASARRTRLRSASAETPKTRATCAIGLPDSNTSRRPPFHHLIGVRLRASDSLEFCLPGASPSVGSLRQTGSAHSDRDVGLPGQDAPASRV